MDKLLGLTLDNDDNKKRDSGLNLNGPEVTWRHGFMGPVTSTNSPHSHTYKSVINNPAPVTLYWVTAWLESTNRGLMPAWRSSRVSTLQRRRWASPCRSPSRSRLTPTLWPWCSLLSAPLRYQDSPLPTDAEEMIRKVTTMDISEIMLTQYQIQSMLIMWGRDGAFI